MKISIIVWIGLICSTTIKAQVKKKTGFAGPVLKISVTNNINPLLKDLAITISCEQQDTLSSLTLLFNDKSDGTNTSAALFSYGRFSGSNKPGISIIKGMKRYHLKYVLPPLVVGKNTITVSGMINRNKTGFQLSDTYSFEYQLPRSDNYMKDNGKTLQFSGIPIFANITYRNVIDIFKDADQDGLLDSWEIFFLEATQPFLRFHPDEEMLNHPDHKVLTLSRVTPFQEDNGSTKRYIVVKNVFAFSKDYGYLTDDGHNGDTQLFVFVWEIVGENTVKLIKMRSQVHEGLLVPSVGTIDFLPEQLTFGLGKPILAVERNKHGLWASVDLCMANSFYFCDGRGPHLVTTVIPPILNVGEKNKTRTAHTQFVDKFDNIKADGPHKKAYGYFMGEQIWTTANFHGGLGNDGDASVGAIGGFLSSTGDQFNITQQMPDVEPAAVTFR